MEIIGKLMGLFLINLSIKLALKPKTTLKGRSSLSKEGPATSQLFPIFPSSFPSFLSQSPNYSL